MKSLKEIFDKAGTDKGSKHSYHMVYEKLWESKRNEPINFLEVGIWKGNGLAALRDYFPKAQIYGIDIFTRIMPAQVPILYKDRIHWKQADSMKPSVTNIVKEFGVEFDFILDDGAHYPKANRLTFKHLFQFLKPGGLYIIEDVWPLEIMNGRELNHPWISKYKDRYNDFENNQFLEEINKSGKVNRYDLRKISGEPDSYVITIEKT